MTLRDRVSVQPPRPFGRRPRPAFAQAIERAPAPALSDELRLFALTFAGGFLFMTVYLA